MSETVELPEEIRSGVVQDCPACEYSGASLPKHIAHKHPGLRERYKTERLSRLVLADGGDGGE